ncbi:MAG: methylthioribulose 1-phosphate dehydratase [Bacteriovoracaceae bacterium]
MHNWIITEDHKIKELVKIVNLFHDRGLCPATSTNFSFRLTEDKDLFVISQSGVDKSEFQAEHLMVINNNAESVYDPHLKPSAETFIHIAIYELFPHINAVLHTHSLNATYLSMNAEKNSLMFENLELLKGLEGNVTHEMSESLPIFPNSQDIKSLSEVIKKYLSENPKTHGLILKGHGLYTWGKDLKTAKRHVETFEYLFQYKMLEQSKNA